MMSLSRMAAAGQAGAWLLLPAEGVPAPLRGRAVGVSLVPLRPDEAAPLLALHLPSLDLASLDGLLPGQLRPAAAETSDADERLAALVLSGATVAQMGRAMSVSTRTVERRLASMRRDLGAKSTAQLAARLAVRESLSRGRAALESAREDATDEDAAAR